MNRVPSAGSIAKSLKHLGSVAEVTSMLTATATIVSAASSIADSSHSAVALIGAVASMVGASASLMGAVWKRDLVHFVGGVNPYVCGVRIGGVPALEARRCRRVDVRVVVCTDGLQFAGVGECVWDGPGPAGVYVDGVEEAEYLRQRQLTFLDVTVS